MIIYFCRYPQKKHSFSIEKGNTILAQNCLFRKSKLYGAVWHMANKIYAEIMQRQYRQDKNSSEQFEQYTIIIYMNRVYRILNIIYFRLTIIFKKRTYYRILLFEVNTIHYTTSKIGNIPDHNILSHPFSVPVC
jgi:hypothetical protein